MKLVFVSNYSNHHQLPFCDAMYRELKGEFLFIQTEPMEEERVRMGWQPQDKRVYVKYYYEEPDACARWIMESQVALFGGTDEESYIAPRLQASLPVIRYSERLYKTGQWKAVSPRGLRKKYLDHTRYRDSNVYLLCAGAYVPSDFHIVGAYPGKMFRWGYFPAVRQYDLDVLMEGKGYGQEKKPYILWAARFIDWKHPELPLRTAAWLKEKGCGFHMDIIGGGELEPVMRRMAAELEVEDSVTLQGFRTPEEVRGFMERADIYLVTSDRQEGWGAVVNEAMNSGCAVVADHMVGAVPYLIRPDENGRIYQDGREEQLFRMTEELCRDAGLRKRLGRAAYAAITQTWNPEHAANCLIELCGRLGLWRTECNMTEDNMMEGNMAEGHWAEGEKPASGAGGTGGYIREGGPCSPAPVIPERRMYRRLLRDGGI